MADLTQRPIRRVTAKRLYKYITSAQVGHLCGECHEKHAVVSIHDIPDLGQVESVWCPNLRYKSLRLINVNIYDAPILKPVNN